MHDYGTLISQGHILFIMYYYGRRNFNEFYSGQFKPYWLPFNPPGQLPVLVVQVPIPVTLGINRFDTDKPTVIQNQRVQETGFQTKLNVSRKEIYKMTQF